MGEVVEPDIDGRMSVPSTGTRVAVNWDTSYEQRVTPQKSWGTVTVAKVADTLLKRCARQGARTGGGDAVYAASPRRAGAAKGQLISLRATGHGKDLPGQAIRGLVFVEADRRKGADAVLGDSDRLQRRGA